MAWDRDRGLAFYTRGTDGSGDFFESMRIAHSGNAEITSGQLIPGTNNAQSLGNTGRRWNFYANTGDFGGSIYARGGVKDDGGDFGTNGQVLTTNGVDQVNWIDSPGAGSVDGTGTAGKITKWSDSDTVTDSSFLSESGSQLTNTASIVDCTTANFQLRLSN